LQVATPVVFNGAVQVVNRFGRTVAQTTEWFLCPDLKAYLLPSLSCVEWVFLVLAFRGNDNARFRKRLAFEGMGFQDAESVCHDLPTFMMPCSCSLLLRPQ
jgi:hypothetical protein